MSVGVVEQTLNKVIKALPKNIPLLGTTATATSRVIDDLVQQFGGFIATVVTEIITL